MIAIVAVDKNWCIGNGTEMLFHLPMDLKFFKETTLGKTVVMGRKTWESLPKKPLLKRENIVLSRSSIAIEGATVITDINELIAKENSDDIFVIGGGEIYNLLLPYCKKAIITKIDDMGKGNVFFPNLDQSKGWELVEMSEPIIDNGYNTIRCVYINKELTSKTEYA
jgi:dihydrofolate reductase